jgi:hypothetical protein
MSKAIYLINGGSSSSSVVEREPELALFASAELIPEPDCVPVPVLDPIPEPIPEPIWIPINQNMEYKVKKVKEK